MRPALFLILGLISVGCLDAQQASLSGPVEAYTFDGPTRSLRAVIGFPGAASFGPVLRENLDFASVAPRQNYGLSIQRGQCLLISGLGTTRLSIRALHGVEALPEGVAWSADGSLAILYSRGGNWLQSITGLPGTPAVGPRIDGSSLGGVLASVAADPKGQRIAAGISGNAGGVFQSTDGKTFTSLKAVANPVSLSFSSDGLTLYALDSGAPQVFVINVSDHGYQAIPLQGLVNPIAIQAVQDAQNRRLLYVAAGSDRLLRIVDLASQQIVSDVPLGFQPTSLDQFGSNSFVVRLRSQAVNPLWLFSSTPQPGAYFVPAIQLRHPDRRRAETLGDAR